MGIKLEVLIDLFKKPFTRKYPKEKARVYKAFRGLHVIDWEKCIACGNCARDCPTFAIKLDPKTHKIKEIELGKCIFCGRCKEVCPVKIIQYSREFELADTKKDKLKVLKKD